MSAGGLDITIDTAELTRRFGLLPGQMHTAARRAAARTRDWLLTQLRRELAGKAELPQQALRSRFKKGRATGEAQAVLWIGLNPLAAHRAGKTVQTQKGVVAGKHVFERAFLARIRPGYPTRVWIRQGKARLPILKVWLDVEEHALDLLPKHEEAAAALFAQRLEHEIGFLLGLDARAAA